MTEISVPCWARKAYPTRAWQKEEILYYQQIEQWFREICSKDDAPSRAEIYRYVAEKIVEDMTSEGASHFEECIRDSFDSYLKKEIYDAIYYTMYDNSYVFEPVIGYIEFSDEAKKLRLASHVFIRAYGAACKRGAKELTNDIWNNMKDN